MEVDDIEMAMGMPGEWRIGSPVRPATECAAHPSDTPTRGVVTRATRARSAVFGRGAVNETDDFFVALVAWRLDLRNPL